MNSDIDVQMNDVFGGRRIVDVQNIVDFVSGGDFIRTMYFVTDVGTVIAHSIKGNVRPLMWAVRDPESDEVYYVETKAKAKVLNILLGFESCGNRWFCARAPGIEFAIWLPLDPSHFEVLNDVHSYSDELLERFAPLAMSSIPSSGARAEV